jgi:hypothetical protein
LLDLRTNDEMRSQFVTEGDLWLRDLYDRDALAYDYRPLVEPLATFFKDSSAEG